MLSWHDYMKDVIILNVDDSAIGNPKVVGFETWWDLEMVIESLIFMVAFAIVITS